MRERQRETPATLNNIREVRSMYLYHSLVLVCNTVFD